MRKFVLVKISSKSEEAIKWALECLKDEIKGQQESRRADSGDPNISIKIEKMIYENKEEGKQ